MIVGTPWRMIVLVTGWTRIWALSGTCLIQTTICMCVLADRPDLARLAWVMASVRHSAIRVPSPKPQAKLRFGDMGIANVASAAVGNHTARRFRGHLAPACRHRDRRNVVQ